MKTDKQMNAEEAQRIRSMLKQEAETGVNRLLWSQLASLSDESLLRMKKLVQQASTPQELAKLLGD